MQRTNTTTLVFLGSCLAFAEIALGTIAALSDANATLVAAFALLALGMVLTALVVMYWREPAFLTLSGAQALDLRRLETLAHILPENVLRLLLEDLASTATLTSNNIRIGDESEVVSMDTEDLEDALEDLPGA